VIFFNVINLAFANGQSTHCWISEQARVLLPAGELSQLMLNVENEIYWRNGSMFPDGGYPIGDDYGEIAHWEPFLMTYMDWIKTEFSYPYSTEAQQHIAFLMGMASHGMADQSFDSMYMSRSWVYDVDQDWEKSMDEATDVVFVAQTHSQSVEELWIPPDIFSQFYEENFNHLISHETMYMGQKFLEIALFYVEQSSQNEELVSSYETQFPWATNNLFDELISGSPPTESILVAKYWQYLWEELQNDTTIEPTVLSLYPFENLDMLAMEHQNIESRWTIVFSSALNGDIFSKEFFSIQNSQHEEIPFDIDLFYGDNSHIVHLMPLEDWRHEEYRLTVSKDLIFSRDVEFFEDQTFDINLRDSAIPGTNKPSKGCTHGRNIRSHLYTFLIIYSIRESFYKIGITRFSFVGG
jgi:hypothetical protein